MIALDPQLVRADLLLTNNRPAPEPTEREILEILEHLAVAPSSTQPQADQEAAIA